MTEIDTTTQDALDWLLCKALSEHPNANPGDIPAPPFDELPSLNALALWQYIWTLREER